MSIHFRTFVVEINGEPATTNPKGMGKKKMQIKTIKSEGAERDYFTIYAVVFSEKFLDEPRVYQNFINKKEAEDIKEFVKETFDYEYVSIREEIVWC